MISSVDNARFSFHTVSPRIFVARLPSGKPFHCSLEILPSRKITADNVCLTVHRPTFADRRCKHIVLRFDVLNCLILCLSCCFHSLSPPWQQLTATHSGLLETPRRRFPNTPKQLVILPLTDRYITLSPLPNFSLSTTKPKIEKSQAVKEKEKYCIHVQSLQSQGNIFPLTAQTFFDTTTRRKRKGIKVTVHIPLIVF